MIEQIGAFAGLAAFIGLAVLALLSFTQGRDIRRLRDWAGSAPERDAERKETTSAIAAQRAEELRALEESRTAEHEAVAQREERRKRREAGLPELTRSERLRERFSGRGASLADPRALVGLFLVVLLIAGGVAYALTRGSDEGGHAGKGNKHLTAKKTQPSEVEVAVLNGTAVPELAAKYGSKLERKGYRLGAVGNSNASFASSVVMYKRGHAPEARQVAKQMGFSKLQLMSAEIEAVSAGANVAVIVGEDNAAAAS